MLATDLNWLIKENDRFRRIIEGYSKAGGLDDILSLVQTWIEDWEKRVSDAEKSPHLSRATTQELIEELAARGRLSADTIVDQEGAAHLIVRKDIACKGLE